MLYVFPSELDASYWIFSLNKRIIRIHWQNKADDFSTSWIKKTFWPHTFVGDGGYLPGIAECRSIDPRSFCSLAFAASIPHNRQRM
jgi:hypothetical protein